MYNWEIELKKLGCEVIPTSNPNYIELHCENIKPRYLLWREWILDIKSINQQKAIETDYKRILLKIHKYSTTNISVNKVYLLNTIHPNAKQLTYNPTNDLLYNNDIFVDLCFHKFVFDETNLKTFVDNVNHLLGAIKIWNFNAAYWRNYKIINFDINDQNIYIHPVTMQQISGKKLLKLLKLSSISMNTANIVAKYFDVNNLEFEQLIYNVGKILC